jgi:hypothetical protein
MAGFLDGSENYWLDDENNGHYSQGNKREMVDGRYIIQRRLCPACGSPKCTIIKTIKKDGISYPVIYCKKYKKQLECIYEK